MKRTISGPLPATTSDEDDRRFQEMEAEAEADIAAGRATRERRLSLRWSSDQVELIRRAAAIYGIPYQTYLKQAAVRQAIADLASATAVGAGR